METLIFIELRDVGWDVARGLWLESNLGIAFFGISAGVLLGIWLESDFGVLIEILPKESFQNATRAWKL